MLLPGQLGRAVRDLAALLPSLPSPHDRLVGHVAAARAHTHQLAAEAAAAQLAAADALAAQLYPALSAAVERARGGSNGGGGGGSVAGASGASVPTTPQAASKKAAAAAAAAVPAEVAQLALAHAEAAAAGGRDAAAAALLHTFIDLLLVTAPSAVGGSGSTTDKGLQLLPASAASPAAAGGRGAAANANAAGAAAMAAVAALVSSGGKPLPPTPAILEAAQARMQLGDLMLRMGRSPAEAAVQYDAAAAALAALYGARHFRVGRALLAAARCRAAVPSAGVGSLAGSSFKALARTSADGGGAAGAGGGAGASGALATVGGGGSKGARSLVSVLQDCLYIQQLSQVRVRRCGRRVAEPRGGDSCYLHGVVFCARRHPPCFHLSIHQSAIESLVLVLLCDSAFDRQRNHAAHPQTL